MSEAISGVRFEAKPATPRDAATVLLIRGDFDREIFWVRRGPQLSFAGGFFAFPGGAVDADDADVPIDNCLPDEVAPRVAALRELFEEAGVLLARGAETLDRDTKQTLRKRLLGGEAFGALLAEAGLKLDASVLLPVGRWVTPPFSPFRFDARFYLCRVPENTSAATVHGELTGGEWIAPARALARWEAGKALLHPPTHHALATLAAFPPEDAVPRLRSPPFVDEGYVVERIEFQRGVQFLPLRTPTLPPAQFTNCWVVGTGEIAVIDPGSPWEDQQVLLEGRLQEFVDEGRRLRCVLLTHHHADHVGGAVAVARRFGAPIWCSSATAERVPEAEGCLTDGEVIELAGPLALRLRCVLTEGHARGHLCFLEERSRALFAGDMVAGGSTIVIDPPEGDMEVYLASLQRLLDLGAHTLYPAHGFAIPDGPSLLRRYLEHREDRLNQILEALEAGQDTVHRLVTRVYADTPSFLHPAAARSALASLQLLENRGRVRRDGERWQPISAGHG
jgi:glyoxylase-like metal-dependent hydrolase (beta-lactamase superfamily II)